MFLPNDFEYKRVRFANCLCNHCFIHVFVQAEIDKISSKHIAGAAMALARPSILLNLLVPMDGVDNFGDGIRLMGFVYLLDPNDAGFPTQLLGIGVAPSAEAPAAALSPKFAARHAFAHC